METVLIILKVLLILSALLMTFFILLQEGKGGGLAGLGGTSAAGVEGVTNPIRKATAYLAGVFFLMAVLIGFLSRSDESVFGKEQEKGKSETKQQTEAIKASDVQKTPTVPERIETPEVSKKADDVEPEVKADEPKPEVKADENKTEAGEEPKAGDE